MKIEQMKSEADVKAEVRKILDRLNAWYYMHVPMGLGRKGIPDFTGILSGRGVGIETKFASRQLSDNQANELRAISRAGGIAIVVNERGLNDLYHLLGSFTLFSPYPTILGHVNNYTYKSNGEPVKHAALDRCS